MALNIASKVANANVLVDLTETVKSAQIVRRGYQVPAAKVDVSQAAKVIGELQVVNPKVLPRVISQSIVPGTKVPAGTAVDLVLAPKTIIPIDIFEGVHAAFKGKTVSDADPIATDVDARKILLTYEDPADVPAPEKQALTQILTRNGVNIDNTKTDTSFDAAFNTMRSVMAFQE